MLKCRELLEEKERFTKRTEFLEAMNDRPKRLKVSPSSQFVQIEKSLRRFETSCLILQLYFRVCNVRPDSWDEAQF